MIEVRVPSNVDESPVEHAIDQVCNEWGLLVGLRGTLAKQPGSLHWHLKRNDARGTLEVTFAPRSGRLWLTVHTNREATWIEEALLSLPERIALLLIESTTDAAIDRDPSRSVP